MPELTVILCTHAPHRGRLERTINGLVAQSLSTDRWEFLLIDNASPQPLATSVDLTWHPGGRIIREERIGLTNARLCGIANARASHVVWVDDDNVLDREYLARALRVFLTQPQVGVFGGQVQPEFETPPEAWFQSIHGPLGISNYGAEVLVAAASDLADDGYPSFAPCGAGMCARIEPLRLWAEAVSNNIHRRALGRTGTNLASGEDNDIVLTALEHGWDIGYFPQISLIHIMPAGRLTVEYHARLLEASNRTWVVTLGMHGISPWPPIAPWTLKPRILRAAVRMRPWKNDVAYLEWKTACGQLAGRADLFRMKPPLAPVSVQKTQMSGATS